MNNDMTDQDSHQRQLQLPEEDNTSSNENGILSKNSTLIVKKKEKSRDAARSRRGKENYEFYELAKLLPIPSETSSQLDKASIVRLTMSFLQLHNFLKCSYNWKKATVAYEAESKSNTQELNNASTNKSNDASNYVEKNYGTLTLQSLDGFIIILNKCGRFLYVSNTVSIYLGLAQVDLVGTSIFTYTHPSDHSELNEYFKRKSPKHSNQHARNHNRSTVDENGDDLKTSTSSFFIRMKSTLTRRGMGIKASGYKVVHISGCFNTGQIVNENDEDEQRGSPEVLLGFAGIAQVLPPPALVDVKLDNPMFVSRLDPSLHVTYCEGSVKNLTCYDVDEIVGESWYKFVSNPDLDKMRSCHMEMLSKGQVVTPYYRWLLKSGASIWVQSNVTIVVDKNLNTDEDSFVWITYMLGDEHQSYLAKTCEDACIEENENNEEILVSSQNDAPQFQKDVAMKILNSRAALISEKNDAPKQICDKKTITNPVKRPLPEKSDLSKSDKCEQSPPVPKKKKICKNQKIVSREPRVPKTVNKEKACKSSKKEEDNDAIHDSYWFNPPNREVSNHSDLPPGIKVQDFHLGNPLMTAQTGPTVIHHHYPFGINPNLLNSNPVLAKMIRTANYVANEPLFTAGDAYILAPQMNFFPQILAPVPNLIANRPNNMGGCCPAALSAIIDELRKDPMRKVNPPNKVVLPSSKSPTSSSSSLLGDAQKTPNNMSSSLPQSQLLNLSGVSNPGMIMQPLARYNCAVPANPIILQPLLHNSSLPI